MPPPPPTARGALRRELGLGALVAYGVGDILGAGIYALVGKVAGIAGPASWLSFGVALCVAGLTATSYAELGRRFPRSGGEAYFCQRAFGWPAFALVIGWLVFCSGVVSLAAVAHAFAGYSDALFSVNSPIARAATILVFLGFVAGVNFWGIRQSSLMNIICTVVEASGLLLVVVVGLVFLRGGPTGPPRAPVPVAMAPWPAWSAIAQGAALAFFAFIGFEDMVNVAEEVRSPRRNLPRAIMLALLIAGSVYIAVVWVATAVVPAEQLATSGGPLLEIVRLAAPAIPPWSFTAVALFAVANTGLLNCIMASRLLYGMAEQRIVPRRLAAVHPVRRTPHLSILTVLAAAVVVAMSGTLVYLAGTTSVLLLLVFGSVNMALVALKIRRRKTARVATWSLVWPLAAAASCLILIGFLPWTSLGVASILVILGVALAGGQWLGGRNAESSP